MNRLITILLCVCGIVVCAFLAFIGYRQEQEAKKTQQSAPPEISCEELLEDIPDGVYSFTLSDSQPGKHFIYDDNDGDEIWDRVIIPVFPKGLKKLGRNYKAIILVMANIPDKQTLNEKINASTIEAAYWLTSPELDSNSYNRLAGKYSSLNFSQSRVLYSGYPKTIQSFGTYVFWAGAGGTILSMLMFGWQSFNLVLAGIRSESSQDDDDEDDQVITNRAGLPTKEELSQLK